MRCEKTAPFAHAFNLAGQHQFWLCGIKGMTYMNFNMQDIVDINY